MDGGKREGKLDNIQSTGTFFTPQIKFVISERNEEEDFGKDSSQEQSRTSVKPTGGLTSSKSLWKTSS